jgi:transposase
MPSLRSNAIRIKRFRELKETLRTDRERLLVGIDIAKAQHVAQLRVAHGRLVVPRLVIPNTTEGFTAFWRQLQAAQRTSGCPEIVCALEPTGTYHEALGRFLESQGADVVLVANQVAHANRKTLDGTWGKSDPKDAHNLCELLERGLVRFYSLPEGPLAELRRLVRLLRRARVERAACQVRWRNTLRPALGPAGEPLPAAVCAQLPAALRAFERATEASAARGRAGRPVPLPPGFAAECTDLVARLTAAQARIATLEAALVEVAAPLPAYRLLLTLPGIGPTLAAILLAEIGDIAWYTKFSQLRKLAGLDIIWVESGEWAGTPRISRAGRSLLRWALYQAALGATKCPAWRTRRAALIAKRQGDRFAFFKATVELAAKLLRLVWGVWRSGRPYDPTRAEGTPVSAPVEPRRRRTAGRRQPAPCA